MKTVAHGRRLGALLFLLPALLLWGCDRDPEPAADEPASEAAQAAWAPFIASHSPAQVPASEPLRVRFTRPVVDSEQVGKPIADLVTVSPALAVEAVFVREHELVITPVQPLTPGQTYTVSLAGAVLPGLPLTSRWQFRTAALTQRLDLRLQGLVPVTDGERMSLSGELTTIDRATPDTVARVLRAEQDGRALSLSWQQDSSGRLHTFVVDEIVRGEAASEVLLRWDGRPLGTDQRGERRLRVPARNEFSITDVRITAAERQYIAVTFSEPLDARQNLAGLVRLDGRDATARIEGSTLQVYPPERHTGPVTLRLEGGLRSAGNGRLGEAHEEQLTFVSLRPGVRFVGQGVVLPDTEHLTVPFEAVNVRAVTVTALRVYRDNIGQFLQNNNLDQGYGLQNVGRYLWRREIPLNDLPRDRWQRYLLDVSDLVSESPGALYQLTLSIDRDQTLFGCQDTSPVQDPERPLGNWEARGEVEGSGWDGIEQWYNNSGYVAWSQRHNPCDAAYYVYGHDNAVSDERNLLASNLGLLAKQGHDNRLHVATTLLRTGRAAAGTEVEVFNYQQQRIGRGTTDATGMAVIALDGVPFYMVARRGDDRGYLKLSRGLALPTSQYDVGGVEVRNAVKGFLYGERDVWRPGDNIYLTFVLEDRQQTLPADHPVTLELIDPRGNVVQRRTHTRPVGQFYPFTLRTADDAPTGTWRAVARLGGMRFERPLLIETVVPNRLSLELDAGDEALRVDALPRDAVLSAQWLSGATASGLRADVRARLVPTRTRFDRFTDYTFDDPARSFSSGEQTVHEGRLDSQGRMAFPLKLVHDEAAPGMLRAVFTSRVFEQGGQFSIQSQRQDYHPWPHYVGLRLPAGDEARNMLLTDTDHRVRIAALDNTGQPAALRDLEVSLYKIEWRWWWDQSGESLARYASGAGHEALQRGRVSTNADGEAEWSLRINHPEWGRYLLRVCDTRGGHCTGEVFYMDWPGWAGRAREERGDGPARLTLYSERTDYKVGETATVQLPDTDGAGRALVSLETGSRILRQFWLDLEQGAGQFQVPITPAMAPNVYVSVTLVQPHAGRGNDRPLRLFGILPLAVSDPATHLEPLLQAPEEVNSDSRFTVTVRETDGRPMTYTLAVVDEGLLGLTGYRTPDPHRQFFRREALGVRTWDLFDEVAGAFAGTLERLVAIGGSDEAELDDEASRRRRFPPVVRFLGAFQLSANETREHEVELPPYLGAVRVMLVAGDNGRYGKAEQTVLVRDPLSLLSTLPRVLGPQETLTVPVNLFVQEAGIDEVVVELDADELFRVTEPRDRVRLDQPGEAIVRLGLAVGDAVGQGDITVRASGGGHEASETVHMTVRSPNPPSLDQVRARVAPGETWTHDFTPHGLPGTNRATLEVSSVPPLNLSQRLEYLIRYPHGCLEQVTSAAFPQLYLPRLLVLDSDQRERTGANIQRAVDRLRGYQLADGSFAYWPGAASVNDWSTSYAGHFLLEARRLGYAVPTEMLDGWREHQRRQARAYVASDETGQLIQAYRLYTLALAGQPETGAMNRLREETGLAVMARWQLAAAYQQIGMPAVVERLVTDLGTSPPERARPDATFASTLRDQALILPVLAARDEHDTAEALARQMADSLSGDQWHSTQAVSWALLALSRFYGIEGQGIEGQGDEELPALSWAWREPGQSEWQPRHLSGVMTQQEVTPEAGEVALRNDSEQPLYLLFANEGVPAAGQETARTAGLRLETRFLGTDGQPLDISRLPQGTDLIARVTVTNTSGRRQTELALTQILPSGWQVNNTRMAGEDEVAVLDYQDIRDDRVLSYLSLNAGEQRTLELSLNASFAGRFYLPGWQVENMYDAAVQGRLAGRWVEVLAR